LLVLVSIVSRFSGSNDDLGEVDVRKVGRHSEKKLV
jgi:hypothetical protein